MAALFVLGVGACSADDDTTDTTTTIAPEIGEPAVTERSDPTAETSSTSETPTTAAPAEPAGAPDPEAAALTLYDAWKADDRITAATVADPSAVESMFSAAPGDYSLYNRCNTGEFGSSSCLYRGNPGTIQFLMDERDGSWVVANATFSPA